MKASVIIVNWNGAHLLRQCLPSVVEAVATAGADNELIVVDDGSTDDSVEFVRSQFPTVRLVAQVENCGFGAACNEGVRISKNPVVVMLNNDMIVEPDFLVPLLEVFTKPDIFAVACKIKKWDKNTVELGRTGGSFRFGFIKVKYDDGQEYDRPVPAFYASGGAVAYNKEKFLAMGGFDHLYYPFYWEDTDLSYRAWKRGWQVYYQPRSVIYHKHQGTIGKAFSRDYVRGISYRNRFFFVWRNITDTGMLAAHFALLIPLLLITTLLGKLHYIRGFFGAIQRLSMVLAKRREEVKHFVRTDAEVLEVYKSILSGGRERHE